MPTPDTTTQNPRILVSTTQLIAHIVLLFLITFFFTFVIITQMGFCQFTILWARSSAFIIIKGLLTYDQGFYDINFSPKADAIVKIIIKIN